MSDAFTCRVYTMYGLQDGPGLGLVASFDNFGGQFNVLDNIELYGVSTESDFAIDTQAFAQWSLTASPVPEPGTLVLTLFGLLAMDSRRRRNRR